MHPSDYPTLCEIRNNTKSDMHLHLEMTPEEVVLGPGHSIELLAKPTPHLLPLTFDYYSDGLQIHPCREFDPDWHVRFNGQVIKAGNPTILADYE
jgi:hypothetical protein